MSKNIILGINAYCQSGKDTFFNLLKKYTLEHKLPYNVVRFAFADNLKQELRPFILHNYNINIFKCSKEEKELVRPLMVIHGKIKRELSDGRYWIDLLDAEIKEYLKDKENQIVVCTDVRYCEKDKDEHYWVKHEMGGKLINITSYKYELINKDISDQKVKLYKSAPNKEEAENTPKLEKQSDYKIEWEELGNSNEEYLYTNLYNHIEGFVSWLGIE